MKKSLIIGIIIVVIIVAVIIGYVLIKPSNTNTATNQNAPTSGNSAGSETTNPNPPTGNSNSPKTVTIEISNFAFNPASVTINKGDSVVWLNKDTMAHTVTSDSGSSELGSSPITSGQTYTHTFDTTGSFNYHCSIHTSMKATITVK